MASSPKSAHRPRGKFADAFPGPRSLCEQCGYCLQGLELHQTCPECGTEVDRSSPKHRPGLPWQQCITVTSWLTTVFWLVFRPGASYRRLHIGGSNRRDRLFMSTFTLGLSVMILLTDWTNDTPNPWFKAAVIVVGIPVASYVEVLGVTFFSRQKGWRVPFRRAERVACYASVGWVPVMWMATKSQTIIENGFINRWWIPAWGPPHTAAIGFSVSMLLLMISILWFELLVWIGVRRVRFANMPDQVR